MSRRAYWQRLLKNAVLQYAAVRWAMVYAGGRSANDPTILPSGLKPSDVAATGDAVDQLFVVRTFSVFEAALREAYPAVRPQADPPFRTRDLIDSVASRRSVPSEVLAEVHAVRSVRNRIVHRAEDSTLDVIGQKQSLARFLRYLPPDWPEDET